jgi:hypothetical protein
MSADVERGRSRPSPAARRLGPWLMWFAVLAAPLAWAVHLFLAWGVVELACLRGNEAVIGLPLAGFVALAVGLPLVVAVAGAAVGWRLRRRLPNATEDDLRQQRARFLAGMGLAMALLSIVMIVWGGAALLVFEPCTT